MKYSEYPNLLQDPEARQNLIGESIVANWSFSADIQATMNPDEVETTRRRSEPNLADIITVAKQSLNREEANIHESAVAHR